MKLLKLLFEKTLYHGTITDNEADIRAIGLVPSVGEFIKQMYDIEDGGENAVELVYAADKNSLQKSANAITAQIAKKLNKSFHDVTEQDVRNHGLLTIIRDGHDAMEQAIEQDIDYMRDRYPFLEPNDWYSEDVVKVDVFLKGPALIRFFEKNNISFKSDNELKSQLVAIATKVHPERSKGEIEAAASKINKHELISFLKRYKQML